MLSNISLADIGEIPAVWRVEMPTDSGGEVLLVYRIARRRAWRTDDFKSLNVWFRLFKHWVILQEDSILRIARYSYIEQICRLRGVNSCFVNAAVNRK